ncbi:MAG: 50S ribosomal protein L11 methyltransferase [Alphaproteobacteria bacterium]
MVLHGRRAALDPLADRFEADGLPLTYFETDEASRTWQLELILSGPPDLDALELGDLVAAVEPLPERDWVAESQRQLPPVHAGRFYVHGSHDRGTAPAGALALEIEAGPAFGSGLHETTQGCLILLDQVLRQRSSSRPTSPVLSAPRGGEGRSCDDVNAPSPPLGGERVGVKWRYENASKPNTALDLGCGSGVLALAYAKATRRPVLASDIDPPAVHTTKENAALNRLARHVTAIQADGLHDRLLRRRRFDPILANILARPLIRLAPGLARRLAPGGDLVLSGLLRRQALPVLMAYRARGLRTMRRLDRGQWTSLWLRKER